MPLPDVNRLIGDIQGSDLARQVGALEEFLALPTTSVSDSDRQAVLVAGVRALEESSNPYPIAERLARFREEAVPPLESLLSRSPSSEAATLAALILVNNGSRLGVPPLVAEVRCGGNYIIPASFALAHAGVADHVPAIIEKLRQYPITPTREFPATEDDCVLNLLDVLNKLRVPLPEDIRLKFSEPQVPQYFRSAVERHHVGGSCS